jgi:hypothetical protein
MPCERAHAQQRPQQQTVRQGMRAAGRRQEEAEQQQKYVRKEDAQEHG